MHSYTVYPTMSISLKQPSNCLKRAETVFSGVLYHARAYAAPVSHIIIHQHFLLLSGCYPPAEILAKYFQKLVVLL